MKDELNQVMNQKVIDNEFLLGIFYGFRKLKESIIHI